jgi:hypothetical protein
MIHPKRLVRYLFQHTHYKSLVFKNIGVILNFQLKIRGAMRNFIFTFACIWFQDILKEQC